MKRRSILIAAVVILAGRPSFAQPQAFVGTWTDRVSGLGEVKLTITNVKQNGQVEGGLEFPQQSTVYTFGDKVDRDKRVAAAMANGTALSIDTPVGGRYDLKLDGGRLVGAYVRNNSKTPFSFKKS